MPSIRPHEDLLDGQQTPSESIVTFSVTSQEPSKRRSSPKPAQAKGKRRFDRQPSFA
jgi:hypothetical protein